MREWSIVTPRRGPRRTGRGSPDLIEPFSSNASYVKQSKAAPLKGPSLGKEKARFSSLAPFNHAFSA